MATIGLGNIKIIDLEDGKTGFIPNIAACVENAEKWYEIPDTSSIEINMHPKRKGNMLEQSLYYSKNKKKRIRKKYDFRRKLGLKCKNYY